MENEKDICNDAFLERFADYIYELIEKYNNEIDIQNISDNSG